MAAFKGMTGALAPFSYLVYDKYISNIVIAFKCGLAEDLCAGLKSLVDYQQSVKYKLTTIKTSWPACTATSSKDR